jgi:hypothetical protein
MVEATDLRDIMHAFYEAQYRWLDELSEQELRELAEQYSVEIEEF